MGMIKEFKDFAMRGNVIDLAIGVVIGTAFSAIVTSMVNDIIMPLFSVLIGEADFKTLVATVGDTPIMYGMFIQSIVNFVIIAFAIFMTVKIMNTLNKKQEVPVKSSEPSNEEILLTEIRDLLKNKKAE